MLEGLFHRPEHIDWQRKGLPPASARLVAQVDKDQMSSPSVVLTPEQLDTIRKRDIRKEPLGFDGIKETSHREREQVAKVDDSVVDAWAGKMVDYLQDRKLVSDDEAGLLNRKFDLMLERNPRTAATEGDEKRNQIARDNIRHRVEVVLWDKYLKGDGTGESNIQGFIEDFVGKDPYEKVVANIALARPFFGIFGGETTIRQIEDGIYAYAALRSTWPNSSERESLVAHVAQTAQHAEEKFVGHYKPDAVGKTWSEKRELKEPQTIQELYNAGWREVAPAEPINPEAFVEEFNGISQRIVSSLSPEDAVQATTQLNEGLGAFQKKVEQEDVGKPHLLSMVDPGDESRPQHIKTYVVLKNSEDIDDISVFELHLPSRMIAPLSENGRLYQRLDSKGNPLWKWYEKVESQEPQTLPEQMSLPPIDTSEMVEDTTPVPPVWPNSLEEEPKQVDIRAELEQKGWEQVAGGVPLSVQDLEKIAQKLPPEQEEVISEQLDEVLENLGDMSRKGYEVLHIAEPQEGDTPEKEHTIVMIRPWGEDELPTFVDLDLRDKKEQFDLQKGRIIFENGEYSWWQPKAEQVESDNNEQTASVQKAEEETMDVNPAPLPLTAEAVAALAALDSDSGEENADSSGKGEFNPSENVWRRSSLMPPAAPREMKPVEPAATDTSETP